MYAKYFVAVLSTAFDLKVLLLLIRIYRAASTNKFRLWM